MNARVEEDMKEFRALKCDLKTLREEVIRKSEEVSRQIRIPMQPNTEWIVPLPEVLTRWVETPTKNVVAKTCSLNELTERSTILNLYCDKGAIIPPHTHDRSTRIFVVEGSYVEMVTGEKYEEGQVQDIPAGVLYGLKTDYALLTLVWQPQFDYEKIYNV